MSETKIESDSIQYLWSLLMSDGKTTMKLLIDKSKNEHVPLTTRQFINWTFRVNVEKRERIFKVVKAQKLIDELGNPLESQYVKMLGWSYRDAVLTARGQGGVILYTCHPDSEWRFIGFTDFEQDEKMAFDVIATTYEAYGATLLCEEFTSPQPESPPVLDNLS